MENTRWGKNQTQFFSENENKLLKKEIFALVENEGKVVEIRYPEEIKKTATNFDIDLWKHRQKSTVNGNENILNPKPNTKSLKTRKKQENFPLTLEKFKSVIKQLQKNHQELMVYQQSFIIYLTLYSNGCLKW